MWWLMYGLLALKKLRQGDQSSRTNLDYIGAPEQRAPALCMCVYVHACVFQFVFSVLGLKPGLYTTSCPIWCSAAPAAFVLLLTAK